MDMSFTQYRVEASDTDDDSYDDDDDDDDDTIENSRQSFISNRKKTPMKQLNIPATDSDTSDEDDESFVIKPKKPNRIMLIDSDSEDQASAHTSENEPTYLSAATRLSMYGVKPSDASDDSDFIQSDSEKSDTFDASKMKSNNSTESTHQISAAYDLTLSPIKDVNMSPMKDMEVSFNATPSKDMSFVEDPVEVTNQNVAGVITVSSDDEVPDVIMVTPKQRSRSSLTGNIRSSQTKISPFLEPFKIDNTYPNSQVVYVTKQTRHIELTKLDSMRQDLSKIRNLLKTMNLDTLPDNGAKLTQRSQQLEVEIKKQAEKVANMVEEPDKLTVEHLKKDGFISWDELQEASKAVKPKMFGNQALNTHMVQQTLTLERLKALHSSLDTRPTDETKAEPPKGLITSLMPHQLHALAWLAWRETECPQGGILADDMGLGKTLTMISLILYSKEKNLDDPDINDENDEWRTKSKGKMPNGGTLVVCPASLLNQWQKEVVSHCKKYSLRTEIHHGNKRESRVNHLAQNDIVITTYHIVQRDLEKNGVLMRIRWRRVILDEAHIVRNHKALTSQAIFKLSSHARWCLTGTPIHNKDLDLFSLLKFLRCSPFDDIITQLSSFNKIHILNPLTPTPRSNTDDILCLRLQGLLRETSNIEDITHTIRKRTAFYSLWPTIFNNSTFDISHAMLKYNIMLMNLWKKWIDNKSTGGQERLATVMKTLMLRRTKQQLQEQNSLKSLPEKTMHSIDVNLSKSEMKVYQKVLVFSKTLFAQFLHQRASKQNYVYGEGGFKGSDKKNEYYAMHQKMIALKGLKEVKSHEILVLLLRLRQICCHPGLIHAMLENEEETNPTDDHSKSDDAEMLNELSRLNIDKDLEDHNAVSEINDEGLSVSTAIKRVLHVSNPIFDLKNQSAKIKSIFKCLNEKIFIHKGDKAIIVSQWTSMLDIIHANLKMASIKCSILSGKVPVPARQHIVTEFNDPNSKIQVLLLSLCAGGVGLNLTGANHLLLTDLHWNPQLEAQAQDRIYRLGQKKSVHIYKFICLETVEQSIKQLQERKLSLAENVLTGVKMTQSSKLSIDDLKLMFNMR